MVARYTVHRVPVAMVVKQNSFTDHGTLAWMLLEVIFISTTSDTMNKENKATSDVIELGTHKNTKWG